jgi:hypothetical protein
MIKVKKTSFEEEQREKDEVFLKLTPTERMDHARKVRERMRKPGVNYSINGLKVKVSRLSS